MANEYNGDKIVLRDTEGNQMSLPLFFKLATRNSDGSHVAQPSSGVYRNGSTEFHGGWDMGCNGATDIIIRTTTAGTAVYVGGCGGFGPNLVIIKEDTQNRYHYFGHMASASVQQGDTVEQGDEVGIAGGYGGNASSGWNPSAYPIHLHYEIMNKNLMVDGGYSTDKQNVIDPMTAFDEATLPSGWQYGYDPDHPSNDYAAVNYNWDYIPLDTGAIDFGPPGGDVPSEPFFTDGYVYDLSTHQTQAEVQELRNDSTTGGFVLRFAWNSGQDGKVASHLADAKAANVPVGFYSAADKNITYDGEAAYRTMIEAQAELLATTMSIKPSDCPLGVWLDLESWGVALGGNGCGMSATPAENLRQIEIFREVFGNKGFPTCGWYSSKNELMNGMLDNTDESWKEFPYWYARPGASRSTVDSEMANFGITNCYLWQDGDGGSNWSPDKTYRHRNVDNDTVLKAIPTTGGGGGGGGGGGSYTLEILVDVIPPKRIYFNPNPGLLTIDANLQNREQSIEILTDAEDATIYYTLDGSAPYEYVTSDFGNITYALSTSATAYSGPIKIYSDTHIRAIAISASGGLAVFDDILAKGSGTFIYSYRVVAPEWSVEREAYALEDSASHEALYEENKQAFILEHTKETIEDVVYASVHLSSNTGGESEASEETPEIEPADSGQIPATPEPEPEDT
jgi:hypothetical protein